ncbi:glycoside hydrolase family 39 protein, partial [Piromyces sp. E2]
SPFLLVQSVNKITIDCGNKLLKTTHFVNVSLYDINENVPFEKDYISLVHDIHPYVMLNPARGKPGNQHSFADAIQVAKLSIDTADILPYWLYQWFEGKFNQVKLD